MGVTACMLVFAGRGVPKIYRRAARRRSVAAAPPSNLGSFATLHAHSARRRRATDMSREESIEPYMAYNMLSFVFNSVVSFVRSMRPKLRAVSVCPKRAGEGRSARRAKRMHAWQTRKMVAQEGRTGRRWTGGGAGRDVHASNAARTRVSLRRGSEAVSPPNDGAELGHVAAGTVFRTCHPEVHVNMSATSFCFVLLGVVSVLPPFVAPVWSAADALLQKRARGRRTGQDRGAGTSNCKTGETWGTRRELVRKTKQAVSRWIEECTVVNRFSAFRRSLTLRALPRAPLLHE